MSESEQDTAAAAGITPFERFEDGLLRPFIVLATTAVTAVQFPSAQLIVPPLAVTLFVVTALASIAALFPFQRVPEWARITIMAVDVIAASALLPLAHSTTVASLFAFLATGTAGAKLASRPAVLGIAITGAVLASGLSWLVNTVDPTPNQWPWWVPLTIALPVYIGTSRRDRMDTVRSAQLAAAEAQRAAESEAREAALLERGRIAREIHDVLGHSLSGIALQLDMADALGGSGRDEEALGAIRKARALAVDSIAETRRAVHALREDTLPMQETLRLLAEGDGIPFEVVGEPGPVPVEAAHTVVRAAQEALTNTVKYAPGAARSIRLEFTAERIMLTVTNGPATAERRAEIAGGTGMGLVGMRERVALLGGTLRAGPAPDGGWSVELEVPK